MAEQPISNDPRYRNRPTIRVDGEAREPVTNRVTTFRIVERERGLSSLELRFGALGDSASSERDPLPFEDERTLKLGSVITIFSGDEQRPREIFRGPVSAIEVDFSGTGNAEMVIHAEDALQRARLARRSKVHDDLNISDFVSDLASRLSLS